MKQGMITWREARAELKRLGGVAVRVKGSHEVWALPGGRTFVGLRNHLGETLTPGAVRDLKKLGWVRG